MKYTYLCGDFKVFLLCFICVSQSDSVNWSKVRCSSDTAPIISSQIEPDLGRFPWLGVIQHSFVVGKKTHYAITGAVLIHPGYAIASAEDMAKINHNELNTTKFVVYHSSSTTHLIDIIDYMLHPDYQEHVTMATIALIELDTHGQTGVGEHSAPVLPICMPHTGVGSYTDLYAAKMTDQRGKLEKQVFKMSYVDDKDCEEFYFDAQLNHKLMKPVSPICAITQNTDRPCIWDAGVVLITRQNWGFFRLIGFSVRSPGCSAPTRFLNMVKYLGWLDEMITRLPAEELSGRRAFAVRQLSPYLVKMYKVGYVVPAGAGQCERALRGAVLYRDNTDVDTDQNFGQGFFFAEVSNVAQFTCMIVRLDTMSGTNTGIWLDHHCHPAREPELERRAKNFESRTSENRCFAYFQTTAYMEFRFMFSYHAHIEITLFGHPEDVSKKIPNPFMLRETTFPWWPTAKLIRWKWWVPMNSWWWNM